jgi:Zn-dependent M28 family amino/carboxypeptidase
MREAIRTNLESSVRFMAEEIGTRSFMEVRRLDRTAEYIEEKLSASGCSTGRQPFTYQNREYRNITGEVRGKDPRVFVVGAHYDTVSGSPGADDNASGVAGMLELARLAAGREPPPLTLRFVAFCLEEPPVFRTSRMGSVVYAQALGNEGVKVEGMMALEMIGYYSDARCSQFYPLPAMRWFYPRRGNFLALVGDMRSRALTKKFREVFKRHSSLPVESLNTVSAVPGVDFSDHRSFWKFGYRAFMVTDTAFYRNPNYHTPGDVPSTLDFDRMTEAVMGLDGGLRGL